RSSDAVGCLAGSLASRVARRASPPAKRFAFANSGAYNRRHVGTWNGRRNSSMSRRRLAVAILLVVASLVFIGWWWKKGYSAEAPEANLGELAVELHASTIAVQLTLGLNDKQPTAWDGQVALSAGRLVEIEDLTAHRTVGAAAWQVRSTAGGAGQG